MKNFILPLCVHMYACTKYYFLDLKMQLHATHRSSPYTMKKMPNDVCGLLVQALRKQEQLERYYGRERGCFMKKVSLIIL